MIERRGTWTEITDERGLLFHFKAQPGGDVEVQVLRGDGYLMASYRLTVDHVAWMYRDSQAAAQASMPPTDVLSSPSE